MKKFYIIAAALFALAVIILGVATSYVLSGPDEPKKPPQAATPPRSGGANSNANNTPHGMRSGTAGPTTTSIEPPKPLPPPATAGRSEGSMDGSTGSLTSGMPQLPGRPPPPAPPSPPGGLFKVPIVPVDPQGSTSGAKGSSSPNS
jgi:hypothetical protein